jgi:D-arginine dehydrogenase
MVSSADIIVIGAGIAGASVAAELSGQRRVILLEAEDQPGYHSTGRSAAIWVPEYGPPVIRALTKASADFFKSPPAGFAENPLLTPRGEMMIALQGQEELMASEHAAAPSLRPVTADEVIARVPLIKKDMIIGGLVDDIAQDIDVDALLQGRLKAFKKRGGQLVCGAPVEAISRNNVWQVATKSATYSAPVIINAAGAWGDEIARLAGVEPVGLVPKRRSACLVPPPEGIDVSTWPLTFGAGETFYFKPSGGQLLVSPADETPVEPHDVWAEDLTIAEGVELFQQVMDMEVTRLTHTWAGLRTFAPDGDPVVGFAPHAEGFFWLVGQGGYGIQTSPALSQVAAALVLEQAMPDKFKPFEISAAALNPTRLAR